MNDYFGRPILIFVSPFSALIVRSCNVLLNTKLLVYFTYLCLTSALCGHAVFICLVMDTLSWYINTLNVR
jgi:hypothetical protein